MEAHEKFCMTIAPYDEAYEFVAFSYLAARHEGEIYLIQSRLDFSVTKLVGTPESTFESNNVFAGHCILTVEERDYAQLLKSLSSGKVKFRGLELSMPAHALHGDSQNVRYIETDHTQGGPAPSIATRHEFDWEVRAASTPFYGVADLAVAHGLCAARWPRLPTPLVP